jgi:hypothetical protein
MYMKWVRLVGNSGKLPLVTFGRMRGGAWGDAGAALPGADWVMKASPPPEDTMIVAMKTASPPQSLRFTRIVPVRRWRLGKVEVI